MWYQRIDDRERAESIARRDYELLFIERGTVISATRDYKIQSLEEIIEELERQLKTKIERAPDPRTGGWGKFVKDHIKSQPKHREKRRVRKNHRTNPIQPPQNQK